MKQRTFGFAGVALLVAVCGAPDAASAQTAAAPTFTKDVAPILQRSCQSCHRTGEIAPMSLTTYQEVRPWARSIRSRVVARDMPPFHVDRNIGITQFKDDPSLSDDEIATISKWVDAGAPQGDPADMPPATPFADSGDWQIGEPDVIIKFPKYRVAGRRSGPVRRPLTPRSPSTRIATFRRSRPARRRGVAPRSSITPCRSRLTRRSASRSRWTRASSWSNTRSGKNAEVYPEGTGVLLQKGQTARLSYHLHSIGEAIDAELEVGIKLYPKGFVPKHIRWSRAARATDHAARHSGGHSRAQRRLHDSPQAGRGFSPSSRTCTTSASVSASS